MDNTRIKILTQIYELRDEIRVKIDLYKELADEYEKDCILEDIYYLQERIQKLKKLTSIPVLTSWEDDWREYYLD